VLCTAGIEGSVAGRTAVVGREIVGDGEFGPAAATQHGRLVEPDSRPRHGLVVRRFLVAAKTGIVALAAGEFERDHVAVGVVVSTPGFRTDVDTVDRVASDRLHEWLDG